MIRIAAALLALAALGCGGTEPPGLVIAASTVGAEAAVTRRQIARFEARHPGLRVELRVTPDAAGQRHQMYVQWLNARATTPDVLQIDVVWTSEFAAAGWIAPLDDPDDADLLPAAREAARWRGRTYAVPWFVDVGLLYWRTDLVDAPPRSQADLAAAARKARAGRATRYGLVWTGARYEGLVTVFLEYLNAYGGGILDDEGRVIVDEPPAIRALAAMCEAVGPDGIVPTAALNWQEEPVRFAFQNGEAAFMRNWPYAWSLLQAPSGSAVAGKVGVTTFPPASGGQAAAALGGAQLAVSRFSEHGAQARALIAFLTEPAQLLERARDASQLPARRSVYDLPAFAGALPLPAEALRSAIDAAVARPATPVYGELSETLQVHVHRALSGQQSPAAALAEAARELRALLARTGLDRPGGPS
ncbi:MAG: ABC transporter substrate-binding protein [Vicinamibacterales bacterium]